MPGDNRAGSQGSGIIFDIKHYSINDGPGIRTTVFFKGCPLHCAWCHNPESISPRPQKMYNRAKCIGCGLCVDSCPENACRLTPGAGIVTDPDRCTGCGRCAEVCPTLATEMSGRIASTKEIIAAIEKDRPFYDESGGGVTFSGGEPTRQAPWLLELLTECGRRHIHRAVDTCGLVKTETLLTVAGQSDLFLFDLKLMDSNQHRLWTGADNGLILHNLERLASSGAAIHIRIPLIRGVNDSEENIESSARFLAELAGENREVHLLPYHNIAENKYARLGVEYDSERLAEPEQEVLQRIVGQFASYGLRASIGG